MLPRIYGAACLRFPSLSKKHSEKINNLFFLKSFCIVQTGRLIAELFIGNLLGARGIAVIFLECVFFL